MKYDTQNDSEQIFTHVIARDFYLTDDGLLYENGNRRRGLNAPPALHLYAHRGAPGADDLHKRLG